MAVAVVVVVVGRAFVNGLSNFLSMLFLRERMQEEGRVNNEAWPCKSSSGGSA